MALLLSSPASPISPLSHVSPFFPTTTVSKVVVSPYSTNVYTSNMFSPFTPFGAYYEYDTGLNTSWLAQKDMTEYLLMRILDKWLYTDEMSSVLRYLKVENGKVVVTTGASNKISDDTTEVIEKKADFIQSNILGHSEMRKLLTRIVDELGYKWYELANREKIVVEVAEKFIHRKLKEMTEKSSRKD